MGHSSYTYQKLFRALYGYSQTVSKSSGKTYKYWRHGVLSKGPYLRPGKNCVVIPPNAFQTLVNFFKTGKNPCHNWSSKGDWKAVYYMDEKDLKESDIAASIEKLLDRTYVLNEFNEHAPLFDELDRISKAPGPENTKPQKTEIISRAKPIVESDWFKAVYKESPKLKKFYLDYAGLSPD